MTGILSSMKTALFLLLLLGAASAVGTLIPQGELPGFYVERYGVAGARIIQALALDHLFSTRFGSALYANGWFPGRVGRGFWLPA